MGKSNSILEQQKSNEEFRQYTIKMQEDMSKQKQQIEEKLSTMIKEHYEKYKDEHKLMSGEYSHLTTVSEWSLNSINKMISLCGRAIMGGRAPEGSEKKEIATNAVAAIKERGLFIENEAFEVIQGILNCFESKTSTKIEVVYKEKAIAPGITLFIGVGENCYAHKDFFNAETIVQTMFVYQVLFSLKEGSQQSKLSDLECYENQKVAFRMKIENQNNELMKLDTAAEDYFERLVKLSSITDFLCLRLEKIGVKIDNLLSEQDSVSRAIPKRKQNTDNAKWKAINKKITQKKNDAYIEWNRQRNKMD